MYFIHLSRNIYVSTQKQYKDLTRKELQQKFKEMGALLIPYLNSMQKNLMRAFDPLPYAELPNVCLPLNPLASSHPPLRHLTSLYHYQSLSLSLSLFRARKRLEPTVTMPRPIANPYISSLSLSLCVCVCVCVLTSVSFVTNILLSTEGKPLFFDCLSDTQRYKVQPSKLSGCPLL